METPSTSSHMYLPGDELDFTEVKLETKDDQTCDKTADEADGIILGPGTKMIDGKVRATRAGLLRKKATPTGRAFWIDTHSKRYIPAEGDRIIGIVTGRFGDYFRLDIGGADQAQIQWTNFEGVTKKTRPDLKNGDVIYCLVRLAIRDMEPEVVCVDSEGKARGLGQLGDAGDSILLSVSLNLVRKLLRPSNTESGVLGQLGKEFKFEITLGMNGRIWLKCDSLKAAVTMANILMDCEFLDENETKEMVDRRVKRYKGF